MFLLLNFDLHFYHKTYSACYANVVYSMHSGHKHIPGHLLPNEVWPNGMWVWLSLIGWSICLK